MIDNQKRNCDISSTLNVVSASLAQIIGSSDKILSKFGQQQLVMVNYVCGSNQSETGKYFERVTLSITIFHASSVGLRYSLVCTCFSFFISIELVTKRNRYICVCIVLIFQMLIDLESLLMSIFRRGLFLDEPLLFISSGREELY